MRIIRGAWARSGKEEEVRAPALLRGVSGRRARLQPRVTMHKASRALIMAPHPRGHFLRGAPAH